MKESGKYIVLLTGDGHLTAQNVAGEIDANRFISDALPVDKENVIKELQAEGRVVAMVGDGINDSQALARADVSIAMGKGTDIAMDVAMVTLMTSDLLLLPKAFKLSHKTVRLIHQNLFWAFIYNLIGIPVAAGILFPLYGILLNPMIASAAMACSSVSVVLNSLSLKLEKVVIELKIIKKAAVHRFLFLHGCFFIFSILFSFIIQKRIVFFLFVLLFVFRSSHSPISFRKLR